jgi:hypothetical protein
MALLISELMSKFNVQYIGIHYTLYSDTRTIDWMFITQYIYLYAMAARSVKLYNCKSFFYSTEHTKINRQNFN